MCSVSLFVVFLGANLEEPPEATLYTLKVAAAIAGPACVICIFIMLLICVHQRRQLARMELNAELSRLQEAVECEIPVGHSIHDLIDMSTGLFLDNLLFIITYYPLLTRQGIVAVTLSVPVSL